MHKFLFEPDCVIALVTTCKELAGDMIAKLTLSLTKLPQAWFDEGLDIKYNKYEIRNKSNHARIIATSYKHIGDIKSLTVNYLYMDEFAFVPKSLQQEVCMEFFPTMMSGASNRKIIISSTTNGKDNEFYHLCVQAMGAKSSFLLVEIPWWDTYNFNVKEMKKRVEQIGARIWMSEYGLFFDDYDD
jgi:phage FluMu gp28-like protein